MKQILARLDDLGRALTYGGFVRFVWATCAVTVNFPNGSVMPVDGRTYQAFLLREKQFTRTEQGSLETKDLVIEETIKVLTGA